MIDELLVRNLGVVAEARLTPAPGLTVITGETGTGKTLLVGALRLLSGGEARSDQVGPLGSEATVEVRLLGKDGETVLRRVVQTQGKSRAYQDGALASARTLAEALTDEVEIVGQHDQLSLTRPRQVLALVDSRLDSDGVELLAKVNRLKAERKRLLALQSQLGGDQRSLLRELELVRFQANEITVSGFISGDDEDLKRQGNRLRNAQELTEALALSADSAEVSADSHGQALESLRRVARLDPDLSELVEAAERLAEEQGDLGRRIRLAGDSVQDDPQTRELVEARLTLLGELRRKYGADLDEVLAFGKEAARREDEILKLLGQAESVESDLTQVDTDLGNSSALLMRKRAEAAEVIAADALSHLRELGFSDPSLLFSVVEDEVGLNFASDSRLTPGPVDRVASGGELSRLVLSLRLAASRLESVTVVFDEIDTGVGGATALVMGRKLAHLARDRQVLCVTHLPQVAAFAQLHYRLSRSGVETTLEEVSGEERTAELARMLAGLPDSERGRQAASELLELASTESDSFPS